MSLHSSRAAGKTSRCAAPRALGRKRQQHAVRPLPLWPRTHRTCCQTPFQSERPDIAWNDRALLLSAFQRLASRGLRGRKVPARTAACDHSSAHEDALCRVMHLTASPFCDLLVSCVPHPSARDSSRPKRPRCVLSYAAAHRQELVRCGRSRSHATWSRVACRHSPGMCTAACTAAGFGWPP
jgi:hypothetical protein